MESVAEAVVTAAVAEGAAQAAAEVAQNQENNHEQNHMPEQNHVAEQNNEIEQNHLEENHQEQLPDAEVQEETFEKSDVTSEETTPPREGIQLEITQDVPAICLISPKVEVTFAHLVNINNDCILFTTC